MAEAAGGLTEALPHSAEIQVVPDRVRLSAIVQRLGLILAQRCSQEELLIEQTLRMAAAQIDYGPVCTYSLISQR